MARRVPLANTNMVWHHFDNQMQKEETHATAFLRTQGNPRIRVAVSTDRCFGRGWKEHLELYEISRNMERGNSPSWVRLPLSLLNLAEMSCHCSGPPNIKSDILGLSLRASISIALLLGVCRVPGLSSKVLHFSGGFHCLKNMQLDWYHIFSDEGHA